MNLIKDILTYVEAQPSGIPIMEIPTKCEDGATFGEHIKLLLDRGLIEGQVVDVASPVFVIQNLTWEGHDFIQAISNEEVWKKILRKAAAVGGGLTLEIALELGKKYLKQQFGLED